MTKTSKKGSVVTLSTYLDLNYRYLKDGSRKITKYMEEFNYKSLTSYLRLMITLLHKFYTSKSTCVQFLVEIGLNVYPLPLMWVVLICFLELWYLIMIFAVANETKQNIYIFQTKYINTRSFSRSWIFWKSFDYSFNILVFYITYIFMFDLTPI